MSRSVYRYPSKQRIPPQRWRARARAFSFNQLRQLLPTHATERWRGADGVDNVGRHAARHRYQAGQRGLIDIQRSHNNIAREFPIFEDCGETRPFDEGQIRSPAVFLSLRNDKLFVGEVADHRANLDPQIASRAQAAMSERDLIPPRLPGIRANQDRHGLSMFANHGAEHQTLGLGFVHSIPRERGIYLPRIEIYDNLTLDELLFNFVCASDLIIDVAQ